MNATKIKSYLISLSNQEIAEHSQRFFKTAKGEYGYGDIFLGIRVPILRKAVKQYKTTEIQEIIKLLASEYHEVRLFALLHLVYQFSMADDDKKLLIYTLYLKHTRYINNWDLVDTTAHHIVGQYLYTRNRDILYQLVGSKSLWERRIAVIASFYFIKNNDFSDTLELSRLLLNDSEDLIHKACGWMLREIGKRDIKVETAFLKLHYKMMPRTMLRYAIEKFNRTDRNAYLKGNV
jgi:3-methyladenine DNA glycosylase AlkD